MKPANKFPVSYIAYLWGCKSIIPKAILTCSRKEIILENLQVITRSLNLELSRKDRDFLNLDLPADGPSSFYDGKAWDVKLTTDEFQELSKEYYPEHATHSCKAESGQGVTIFAFRIRDLRNIHDFERAIHKYIRIPEC